MPIGVSRDHLELSSSLQAWATGLDASAALREVEDDPHAAFEKVWQSVVEMDLTVIGIDADRAGGGGDLLDQMVALESAARGLIPGPLLATTLVGQVVAASDAKRSDEVLLALAEGASAAVALTGTVAADGSGARGDIGVALDVVGARWLLVAGDDTSWLLIDSDGWEADPVLGVDLSRRGGRIRVEAAADHIVRLPAVTTDQVARLLVALAAAEASGVAKWCLDTAVAYAKVREQFGAPIGSFQAIKHLCSEMLETAESVSAAAWDVGVAAISQPDEANFAADVAATIAFDGTVAVAHHCIQVLGGIGFTFEHDSHLYLRRAMSLRGAVASLTGGADESAVRLARRASDGQRRASRIDFDGTDVEFRATARAELGEIAALPETEQRAALARAGHLTPHWPRPYGLDAGPVEQLVDDEEMERAGLSRPDIKIGGWAVPTIIQHGTDEQREQFVLPTLLGDIAWCQLFSEPGAGSDLAALSTRAERTDGGWLLTGQKVWTSLAHTADWGICLARTDRDARHKGITYFLVDMRSDGIELRPLREMTGDAMFNEVFLDSVFVPDDYVVGEVNDGWKLARTTLANERVAMAGNKLGLSTERAVELLTSRDSATDAARVGRQVAMSTVGDLLGVRATLRSIAGQSPGPESSVAKLLSVRNRQEASDLVMDLHGPEAVLVGGDSALVHDLHEALLTRCLSIAGGTTQILRNVVAERILGLPRG